MKRLATRYIVVHHSVTPRSWDMQKTLTVIGNSHKDRRLLAGQGMTAYHLMISGNWTAITRPEDSVGYHANNYPVNLTSYAVCLTGNFQVDNLTKYQKNRLEGEIRRLKALYPNVKVIGHREASSTACPGRNITPEYIGYLNILAPVFTDDVYTKLFRKVWGQNPNVRDVEYFKTRVDEGSISKSEKAIRQAMKYWYGIAHPWSWRYLKQMPSEQGLKRWKKEIAKWLDK